MDHAPIQVTADGLAMIGVEQHRDYLESVRDGRREAFMAELLESTVRAGDTVVDVGAFLGHFTLLAARAAGPSGHVHAFEPDPRDYVWLVRNIQVNGFTDRVTAEAVAVSDRGGTASALSRAGPQRKQHCLRGRRSGCCSRPHRGAG